MARRLDTQQQQQAVGRREGMRETDESKRPESDGSTQ